MDQTPLYVLYIGFHSGHFWFIFDVRILIVFFIYCFTMNNLINVRKGYKFWAIAQGSYVHMPR